jgi:hypothetical protein
VSARLASHIWVAAYLQRLGAEGIAAYIAARGDATSGAVLVKLALMNGQARAYHRVWDAGRDARAWALLAEGEERAVDASITRQRSFDPDLWVIEVEDPRARHLLDTEGLE